MKNFGHVGGIGAVTIYICICIWSSNYKHYLNCNNTVLKEINNKKIGTSVINVNNLLAPVIEEYDHDMIKATL